MPRSKNYKKHKKLRQKSRKIKGGFLSSYSVPTNTIPFNQQAGGMGDPSSSINQIPTRLLPMVGGKRKKSKRNKSKRNKSRRNKSKRNKSKIIRGGAGMPDFLLGSSTGASASQTLTAITSASTSTAMNLFSGISGVNPATYVQPAASNTNVLV